MTKFVLISIMGSSLYQRGMIATAGRPIFDSGPVRPDPQARPRAAAVALNPMGLGKGDGAAREGRRRRLREGAGTPALGRPQEER